MALRCFLIAAVLSKTLHHCSQKTNCFHPSHWIKSQMGYVTSFWEVLQFYINIFYSKALSKILTIYIPYLTPEGGIWGDFCEFKIWCMFYIDHCDFCIWYHIILELFIIAGGYILPYQFQKTYRFPGLPSNLMLHSASSVLAFWFNQPQPSNLITGSNQQLIGLSATSLSCGWGGNNQ